MMQKQTDLYNDTQSVFKWAFLLTAGVSSHYNPHAFFLKLNVLCCVACGYCAVNIKAPEDEELPDDEAELPALVLRGSRVAQSAPAQQQTQINTNFSLQDYE